MKKSFKWILIIANIVVLGFIVITNFGGELRYKMLSLRERYIKPVDEVVVPVYDYPVADEIRGALDNAHSAAKKYASDELDAWISEVMARADEDFIDEYFNFLNVKMRELKTIKDSIVHFFNKNAMTAEEAANLELEEEIEKKVVRPEISQMRIENIMNGTVSVYMENLDIELAKLQEKHRIPTPDWNRYIVDLTGITLSTELDTTPIKMKLFITGTTAGTLVGLNVAMPVLKKVGQKIAAKVGAKTAAKIAAEAGAKAGVKAGAKASGTAAKAIPVIGWGITAAVCIWDLIEYNIASKKGKIELRASLSDYFYQIKIHMLSNSENSVMGCLTEWENKIKARAAQM